MATLVGACPRSPFHGGTIDAIAARVNALVRNSARAEAMGKPGRRRVIEHFAWG